MKSNNPKVIKLLSYFEKSIIIILLLAIFFSYGVYINIKAIYDNNSRIVSYQNEIDYQSKTVPESVNFDKDISFVNYDLWLRNCANIANVYIYRNTNDLKILSDKSQSELNTISQNFKITDDKISYDSVVKFIIIDKINKTFITNNMESVDTIKKNIDDFSKENGSLYNYIVTLGKCYNISYNSKTTPISLTNTAYSQSSNNYVEAYWFPKNYTYSTEDYEIINKLYTSYKNNNFVSASILKGDISRLKSNNSTNTIYIGIFSGFLLIIILIISMLGFSRIKAGIVNSLLAKFIRFMRNRLQKKSTTYKILLFGLLTLLFSFALLHIVYQVSNYNRVVVIFKYDFIIVFLYLVFVLPKFIKFSKYTDEIIKGAEIIVSGNLSHEIRETGDLALSSLACNINKLNKGFKVSIDDQIKNERLKSELVANVSHDLKTPLTSIINYTDILMANDVTEEERNEYLEILNRKSLKLKKLIEDLFEISKINSGKAEITLEIIDIVELLNQTVAEYSDSDVYSDKNLCFVIKPFNKKIEMSLDGKKMSRVFENLIINSLKYSLNNTRVIIEIIEIEKGIEICFKNVSSIPLDFDQEEIFERFTRGDRARNSQIDGNGLGLAIARSIVELHGGNMHVEFDGDLFKSIIDLYM